MTHQMRQRLIGGLVIVAILAIFLPILFHNPQPTSKMKIAKKIPPAPSVPQVEMELPNITQSNDAASKVAAQQTAAQRQQRQLQMAKTSDQLKPTHQALNPKQTLATTPPAQRKISNANHYSLSQAMQPPKAWSIQIGSFSSQKNVRTLLKRLRDNGFDAYVRSTHDDQGKMLVKVYVGPEIRFEHAEKLQAQLQQKFHLKGLIVKYKIQ